MARQVIQPDFDTLDGSWAVSLPASLANGEVAGRDFIFTYGPLYQIVHGFGLLIPPNDLASLLRFQFALEVLLVMLGVWVVLWTTGAPLLWRMGTYLVWSCIWPQLFVRFSAGLKPLGGLVCCALAGYVLAAPFKNRLTNSLPGILIWSLAVPLCLLYAFDVGVLVFLALVLTWIVAFLAIRLRTKGAATHIHCLAALLFSTGVFVMVLSVSVSWGHYLRDSWKLSAGYLFTMAWPMEQQSLWIIFLVACCLIVFVVLIARRLATAVRADDLLDGRFTALLAMLTFCLVCLRLCLTRSDPPHILFALLPSLFFAACVLPCYLALGRRHFRWLILTGLIFVLLLPSVRVTLRNQLTALLRLEFKAAELEVNRSDIREASKVARDLPGDSLYVWPHQTLVNAVAGKRMSNYTLQSYAATTDDLELSSIAQLDATQDLSVILFTNAPGIDGVESLSRTPKIFRHLLERYELAPDQGQPGRPFFVLKRRGGEKRQLENVDLFVGERHFAPGRENSLKISFPVEAEKLWRASDLIALRLRLARTRLFGFRKPGAIFATFFLSNGEQRTQNLVVPPDGDSHELLVSATSINDPLFLSHFSTHRLWRSKEWVVALQIEWSPLDPLSARPDSITVERISTLHPVERSVIEMETSLSQQNDPSLWHWCYANGPYPNK